MDNEGAFIVILAVIILFGFMAYLLPELLNTAYASTAAHYAQPLLLGLAITVTGAFVYFLAKRID